MSKTPGAGTNNPFKEKRYTVVIASDVATMATAVDEHLADGWLPWGSLVVLGAPAGMSYCQAMVSEAVLDGLVDALVPRIANIVAHAAKHPR